MIQQEKKKHRFAAGTLMCLSFAAAALSFALCIGARTPAASAPSVHEDTESRADDRIPSDGPEAPIGTQPEAADQTSADIVTADPKPAAPAPEAPVQTITEPAAAAPTDTPLPETTPAAAELSNTMLGDSELTDTLQKGSEPGQAETGGTAPSEPAPSETGQPEPAPTDTAQSVPEASETVPVAAAAEAEELPADASAGESAENADAAPVVYSLPANTVVAPKPSKDGYGNSKDPADTVEVLAAAAPLLNGRELFWSPDRSTGGKQITWYRDDTILAIAWREKYEDLDFTFCEIVVGHPSQFRRYLADNSFRSQNRYTPSQMSKTVHAVVGLSGDFFSHRTVGIVVYRGKLYRADGKTLDTCFVDSSGNLLFVKRNTLKGEKAIKAYIKENDIVFSLAFGPIMLENGEIRVPKERYPVGQIHSKYTRCAISQLGECHYLFAIAGRPKQNTLWTMAKALRSMGIENAYALDGGQTATIVINKKVINPVDYASERLMGDIMYFATAIPEEG